MDARSRPGHGTVPHSGSLDTPAQSKVCHCTVQRPHPRPIERSVPVPSNAVLYTPRAGTHDTGAPHVVAGASNDSVQRRRQSARTAPGHCIACSRSEWPRMAVVVGGGGVDGGGARAGEGDGRQSVRLGGRGGDVAAQQLSRPRRFYIHQRRRIRAVRGASTAVAGRGAIVWTHWCSATGIESRPRSGWPGINAGPGRLVLGIPVVFTHQTHHSAGFRQIVRCSTDRCIAFSASHFRLHGSRFVFTASTSRHQPDCSYQRG